jgi:PAS domain S-box-containing protein
MNTLIHILHLEDDPMDAELVQILLREASLECQIVHAQTQDEFQHALDQNVIDIILADYRLPSYDGLSALRLTLERWPEIPFIFVSGTMGEDAAIEALTQGATDYVLKHQLSRLVPAVQRALQEARNRCERRQAQEALIQSESKMRNILDSVEEGFIVIDRDYRILSANRAFCNLVGLNEDLVVGRFCHEVTHKKSRPCFLSSEVCPVKDTFEAGTIQTAMHTHEGPSGDKQYVELKTYPITDASGAITSVIETVTDVTEKRKLQEQLAQSQKMESVARLAGGVAHDFNNMLGAIIGHTELAMGQVESSHPLLTDLKEILSAAERSAALVKQLLAFARKQTAAPKVLDLNETVADILKMLQSMIGEDIDLTWRPADDLWPVKMDPTQIDQILANLCINARDAIAGIGGITIETGRVTLDPAYCKGDPDLVPGEYDWLTVSDTGTGMAPEIVSKIFEPFFTTKDTGRGTGLGLATVYGIVRQNNGFIHVDSEPGQGTTFKVYLPRHATETLKKQPQTPAAPVKKGHETILLVEDEPTILNMTKMMLERFGYQVLPAPTPGEAIRLVNAHDGEIQLLIADVIMPEMNGRDLAKAVVSRCPKIGCLFMSGYSEDIIAHSGVLDEGIHFIQKPFTMQDLTARVRQVLEDDRH